MTYWAKQIWLTIGVASITLLLAFSGLSLQKLDHMATSVTEKANAPSMETTPIGLFPIPDPISTPGAGRGKGPEMPCGKDENGNVISKCGENDDYTPCPGTCLDENENVINRFCNKSESPCPNSETPCPTCIDTNGNKICKSCDTNDDGKADECTKPTAVNGPALVPVGVSQTYTGTGDGAPCFSWSGGDEPGSGNGESFTTKWTSPGQKTVTASGAGGWTASKMVTVVEVEKVVRVQGMTELNSPVFVTPGAQVSLKAKPTPDGAFPDDNPTWTLKNVTTNTNLDPPSTGPTPTITLNQPGEYEATAYCGTSSAKITIKVVEVLNLSIDSTSDSPVFEGTNNSVVTVKKMGEKVVLKATTNPDEQAAWDLIQWSGGGAVASNKRSVSKDTPGITTITATCGNSQKSKEIVIVWVEFTKFQTAPPTPSDCEINPQIWGTPQYRACNGVLMQAKVTPENAANYGITFDIKRTKEVVSWRNIRGTWRQLRSELAGTDDDDPFNDPIDEDNTPSLDGYIYSMDAPGDMKTSPLSGERDFVYVGSFIESVNVIVSENTMKGSDDYPWHSRVWVKTEPTWFFWRRYVRHNEIVTNKIEPEAGPEINHTDPPTMW